MDINGVTIKNLIQRGRELSTLTWICILHDLTFSCGWKLTKWQKSPNFILSCTSKINEMQTVLTNNIILHSNGFMYVNDPKCPCIKPFDCALMLTRHTLVLKKQHNWWKKKYWIKISYRGTSTSYVLSSYVCENSFSCDASESVFTLSLSSYLQVSTESETESHHGLESLRESTVKIKPHLAHTGIPALPSHKTARAHFWYAGYLVTNSSGNIDVPKHFQLPIYNKIFGFWWWQIIYKYIGPSKLSLFCKVRLD